MPKINSGQKILVFDANKRFLTCYGSAYVAAKELQLATSSIRKVCQGEMISCGKRYFRYLPDDIEMSFEDIGVLTLKEFDEELCGVKRKVYRTSEMSRKGMKYQKHPKRKETKEELYARLGITPIKSHNNEN